MSMIHEITAAVPRLKKPRRKGRGESSGRGKTAGRGHKGAKARAGTYIKRGHEGGQTPIFRRLPKRGFSNFDFERRFHIVNVSDLDRFDEGATVDATVLLEAGLVRDTRLPVKVLGNGTISRRVTVVADAFTGSAEEKITQAGGTVQKIGKPQAAAKPQAAGEKATKEETASTGE